MTATDARQEQRCADCGIDTCPGSWKRHPNPRPGSWEWYMVHDDVWQEAGMDDGMLCVSCLEQRLGRALTVNDLTDASVNMPEDLDTPRLRRIKQQLATALAWAR